MENMLLTEKEIEDLLSVERILTRVLDKITILDTNLGKMNNKSDELKKEIDSFSQSLSNIQLLVEKTRKELGNDIKNINQTLYTQGEEIHKVKNRLDDMKKKLDDLAKANEPEEAKEEPKEKESIKKAVPKKK